MHNCPYLFVTFLAISLAACSSSGGRTGGDDADASSDPAADAHDASSEPGSDVPDAPPDPAADVLPDSAGDPSEDPAVETTTDGTDPCASITADYYTLLSGALSCSSTTDCQALAGQCGVGLGGCWEVVNMSVTQAQLDELGAAYSAAGCTGAVCDCAPAPDVDCSDAQCIAVY